VPRWQAKPPVVAAPTVPSSCWAYIAIWAVEVGSCLITLPVRMWAIYAAGRLVQGIYQRTNPSPVYAGLATAALALGAWLQSFILPGPTKTTFGLDLFCLTIVCGKANGPDENRPVGWLHLLLKPLWTVLEAYLWTLAGIFLYVLCRDVRHEHSELYCVFAILLAELTLRRIICLRPLLPLLKVRTPYAS
jgi:hypothetical protein